MRNPRRAPSTESLERAIRSHERVLAERGVARPGVTITEGDVSAIAAATSRILHGPPAAESATEAKLHRLREADQAAPSTPLHQLDAEALNREATRRWNAYYGDSPLTG